MGKAKKAKKKPGVMLYFDLAPTFEAMSGDDCRELVLAILHYAELKQDDHPKGCSYFWGTIKRRIDDDDAAYYDRVNRSGYEGYKAQAERDGKTPLSYAEWLANRA